MTIADRFWDGLVKGFAVASIVGVIVVGVGERLKSAEAPVSAIGGECVDEEQPCLPITEFADECIEGLCDPEFPEDIPISFAQLDVSPFSFAPTHLLEVRNAQEWHLLVSYECPILMEIANRGKSLAKLHCDGKLETSENYNPNEAARIFWLAMARIFPPTICEQRQEKLFRKIEKLRSKR